MISFETLLSLAQKLVETCIEKKVVISAAESCTGGLLSCLITSIPGSSAMFDRSFVTYSYSSKTDLLNVDSTMLQEKGAVSLEVAHDMAIGALKNSDADITISITGIAGPGGATPNKPVGLVNFAIAKKNHTETFENIFSGNRTDIRMKACEFALKQLIQTL